MVKDVEMRIRPLVPGDIESLVTLVKEAIDPPFFDVGSMRKLFEWKIAFNPLTGSDLTVGYVLEAGGRIEGAVVLMPARFKLKDTRVRGCYEVDLMVRSEARFHGLKLLDKVWKTNTFPIVVATTPNDVSFRLETLFGAKAIAFSGYKYVMPLTFALRLLSWRPFLRKNERFSVRAIERFDEQFDRFFDEVSKEYDIIGIRDNAYLNWRYIDFPFGQRVSLAIYDVSSRLRGYEVIQKECAGSGKSVANIIELFTHKNDTAAMNGLLDASKVYAANNGCARIEMIAGSAAIARQAGLYGFLRRKMRLPSCIYKMNDELYKDMAEDANNWFISSADGDTSIYSALSVERSK
jgi:hypothetical protein